MKISEILKKKRTLSFEVFPPKRDGAEELGKLLETIGELKALSPDFISVTYGASGTNVRGATEIAAHIKKFGLEPLAHVTGGPSSFKDIDALLDKLDSIGAENILALRGDRPAEYTADYCRDFAHATDLIDYIGRRDF